MPPWRVEASEDIDEAIWRSHPETKARLARDTALLVAGRSGDDNLPPDTAARIRQFINDGGLDDVAGLWAESGPLTLAGALWRLYRVREGILAQPADIARLVSLGYDTLDTIDPVVVGLGEPITPDSVADLIDRVFFGGLEGDLSDALTRAGALAKVVAQGLLEVPHDDLEAFSLAKTSLAWGVVANELIAAGQAESRGGLT